MFPFMQYTDGRSIIQKILIDLNIKKGEIAALRRKTGIDPQELNGLLNQMKHYHSGVYQHSLNVAHLSAQLACQLKLTAVEIYIIAMGALFHDIGKVNLTQLILDKTEKLSPAEWLLVKKHPQAGVNLISGYNCAEQLKPLILLHHERLDGQGYYQILPEQIPHAVRIISIADAFDAMVSPRSYQPQRDQLSCWEEIERCSGTQFDPDLLPGFYAIISNK